MSRIRPDDRQARLDDLLIKTSRTFALSIPQLPQPLRAEVTVAYLLFRIADTLEDATRWSAQRQQEELAALGGLLLDPSASAAREMASRWADDPPLEHAGYLELLADMPLVLEAMLALDERATVQVRKHTLRTIECMAGFVRRSDESRVLRIRDIPDLQAYCYAVAGIVGEMLTELFVLECDELRPVAAFLRQHAARFGEALQLVNILKDSATDVDEGRSYLPASVDRADVFALAREDLEGAGRYVQCLQQAGAPRGLVEFTALPVLLAWRTLDRVEEEGPGSKLTRAEVLDITRHMTSALDRRLSPVPGSFPGPDCLPEA